MTIGGLERAGDDAGSRRADHPWDVPYVRVVALGFALGILLAMSVLKQPNVVQVVPAPILGRAAKLGVTLPVTYVLTLGTVLGLVARNRTSAVAVGVGVGAAGVVVSTTKALTTPEFFDSAGDLLAATTFDLTLGVVVAGVAVVAQRCGRAWGAPALVGPDRDDHGASPDTAGDPTAHDVPLRPAALQVALFGVVTVAGLSGAVLAVLEWPQFGYDVDRSLLSMGVAGMVLLAGVAGAIAGLRVERPSRRGVAWVAGGAVAGYTLYGVVSDGAEAAASGSPVVAAGLFAAVVLVAAAIRHVGDSSWERAARVATVGTVLAVVLDLAAAAHLAGRPFHLWSAIVNVVPNYATVVVVAAAGYAAVGTLAGPPRMAALDDSRVPLASRHVRVALVGAIAGSLPLLVMVTPIARRLLVALFHPRAVGVHVRFITDLSGTWRHLQLLAVGVGAAAGIVARDDLPGVATAVAGGLWIGTLLPTVLWLAVFDGEPGPTVLFVSEAYHATVVAAAAGLAVAVGRWYGG